MFGLKGLPLSGAVFHQIKHKRASIILLVPLFSDTYDNLFNFFFSEIENFSIFRFQKVKTKVKNEIVIKQVLSNNEFS